MSDTIPITQNNKPFPLSDSSHNQDHIYLTLSNDAMNTISYHDKGTNRISSYSIDKLIINLPRIKHEKYYKTPVNAHNHIRLLNSRNKYDHNVDCPSNKPVSHTLDNHFDNCSNIVNTKSKPFDIKIFMLNHRNYSKKEKESFSSLDKNELGFRSPGKGMYIRINKYRNMTKYEPFHLTESSLLPSNIIDKNNKEENNKLLPRLAYKLDPEKVFKKENEAMLQYRHHQRKKKTIKISKVIIKSELLAPTKRKKKIVVNQMRDQEIYKLILQHGDEKLRNKFACYDFNSKNNKQSD